MLDGVCLVASIKGKIMSMNSHLFYIEFSRIFYFGCHRKIDSVVARAEVTQKTEQKGEYWNEIYVQLDISIQGKSWSV